MKTPEEILHKHVDPHCFARKGCYEACIDAMEEYAEHYCLEHNRFILKPTKILKPLEKLYIKENPRKDGKFYLPDTTEFYKWIKNKILQK